MLSKGLMTVGGAVGGAGVYGFLLYAFPLWLSALCLLGGLALIGASFLLGGNSASTGNEPRSPQS